MPWEDQGEMKREVHMWALRAWSTFTTSWAASISTDFVKSNMQENFLKVSYDDCERVMKNNSSLPRNAQDHATTSGLGTELIMLGKRDYFSAAFLPHSCTSDQHQELSADNSSWRLYWLLLLGVFSMWCTVRCNVSAFMTGLNSNSVTNTAFCETQNKVSETSEILEQMLSPDSRWCETCETQIFGHFN